MRGTDFTIFSLLEMKYTNNILSMGLSAWDEQLHFYWNFIDCDAKVFIYVHFCFVFQSGNSWSYEN